MIYAEYVQQIKHLHYSPKELEQILNESPIKLWAYCIHDKDQYEDGTPKEPHVHVEMMFYSDQTFENIAKWFKDSPERIEKGKYEKRGHAFENMCSYMIHETENADGKYHYDEKEVVANFPFPEFMEKIRTEVAVAKSRGKRHPIEEVLVKICNNEIPRIKIGEYLSDMERIKYDKDITKAYNIRDEKVAKETDRDMNVMYFAGDSGTGKTTVAKFMAKSKGYSVFVSGSSNDPLQGYIGQECIILDDLRGSDWKINDLLKLLDNNTNSLVKSRYSNKLMNDCKLIIITSVQQIDDMYFSLKEHDSEPIEQLKRRCSDYIYFDMDTMYMYRYDEEKRDYVEVNRMPNMTSALVFMKKNKSMLDDLKNALEEEGEMPWSNK